MDQKLASASLQGPDLTRHLEQRSKCMSPGMQMGGAVAPLAPDIAPQVLLAVLATVGERDVGAVVVALVPTRAFGRRDSDRVLRTLKRSMPHLVVVNVDPESRSHTAPAPFLPAREAQSPPSASPWIAGRPVGMSGRANASARPRTATGITSLRRPYAPLARRPPLRRA